MRLRASITIIGILVGASTLTLCHPPTPTVAKVEVLPYATATGDDARVKDITSALGRAEQVIRS
jgi:hypothetical protein